MENKSWRFMFMEAVTGSSFGALKWNKWNPLVWIGSTVANFCNCKFLCATCETVAAALKLATQAKDDEHARMNTKGETLAKRHCLNAKTKESEAKWIVFDQLSQKRHQIEKKLGSCKIPSCKSLCPTCEKVDADLKLATQAMIDFSLTIEYANKGESLASLEAKSKNLLETAALFKKRAK